GAGGEQREAHAGAGRHHLTGDLPPRAVATHRDHGGGARLDRGPGEPRFVARPGGERVLEGTQVTPQQLEVAGNPAPAAAPPGGGIEDDVDPTRSRRGQMRPSSSNVWRPPRIHCSRNAEVETSLSVSPEVISCSCSTSLPRS